MTQYKAKSTLISKGERYQQGQVFSEADLKGLSPEQITAHFTEIVSQPEVSKTQASAEINDDTTGTAPASAPVSTPVIAPAPKGKGGKGKAKGKGGKGKAKGKGGK